MSTAVAQSPFGDPRVAPRHPRHPEHPHLSRPLAMRLIIAYKFAKAPLLFALALWLTFSPNSAFALVRHIVAYLSEHTGLWHRLADWLGLHITIRTLTGVRWVAWLDGALTLLEGVLLFIGKSWGEWLVVFGLAALLPFEAYSLIAKGHWSRAAVLGVNMAIVGYLLHRQLERHRPAKLARAA